MLTQPHSPSRPRSRLPPPPPPPPTPPPPPPPPPLPPTFRLKASVLDANRIFFFAFSQRLRTHDSKQIYSTRPKMEKVLFSFDGSVFFFFPTACLSLEKPPIHGGPAINMHNPKPHPRRLLPQTLFSPKLSSPSRWQDFSPSEPLKANPPQKLLPPLTLSTFSTGMDIPIIT